MVYITWKCQRLRPDFRHNRFCRWLTWRRLIVISLLLIIATSWVIYYYLPLLTYYYTVKGAQVTNWQDNLPQPGTNKENVAVLVVQYDGTNAVDFVLRAKPRLLETRYQDVVNKLLKKSTGRNVTSLNVIYYVFYNGILALQMPATKDIIIAHGFILRGETNPCRVYLDHAEQYRFFDRSRFDYVLSFDPRLQFEQTVNLTTELLIGDFVAVRHPIFDDLDLFKNNKKIWPYDRSDDSCAHVKVGDEASHFYASSFFGGKTEQVEAFCKAIIEKCDKNSPPFYQVFNRQILEQTPTNLSPYFTWSSDVKRQGAKEILDPAIKMSLRSDSKLAELPFVLPYPGNNIVTQSGLILDFYDGNFYEKRHRFVANLVESIKRNYVEKISQKIKYSPSSSLKVLSYRCHPGDKCGSGLGERMRGVASLLYLAITTGRLFHIDWTRPIHLDQYYQINHDVYKVPQVAYNKVVNKAAALSSQWFEATELDEATSNLLSNIAYDNFPTRDWKDGKSLLQITTNRGHSLLRPLFHNILVYPAIYETFPGQLPEYLGQIDYSAFLSASLRTTLGGITAKLRKVFQDSIVKDIGEENWSKSAKIGVQIRAAPGNWGEKCGEVGFKQLICFVEWIVAVIRTHLGEAKRHGIVIFVTSDLGRNATTEIGRFLMQYDDVMKHENITLVDTSELPLNHLDVNDTDMAWREMARAYLDWHLLTEMDWLIISRSSYGETASIYSLKPTLRLDAYNGVECSFNWYNLDVVNQDHPWQ